MNAAVRPEKMFRIRIRRHRKNLNPVERYAPLMPRADATSIMPCTTNKRRTAPALVSEVPPPRPRQGPTPGLALPSLSAHRKHGSKNRGSSGESLPFVRTHDIKRVRTFLAALQP